MKAQKQIFICMKTIHVCLHKHRIKSLIETMTKSSISLSAESIKSVQRGKQIAFLTLPLSSSTENSMNYRLVGSKGIFHLVLQVNTSIVLSLLFSE